MSAGAAGNFSLPSLRFASEERRRPLRKTDDVESIWHLSNDSSSDEDDEIIYDMDPEDSFQLPSFRRDAKQPARTFEKEIDCFCDSHAGYWDGGEVPEHISTFNWFCGSRKLGILWASITTEMLTYRRISEQDLGCRTCSI